MVETKKIEEKPAPKLKEWTTEEKLTVENFGLKVTLAQKDVEVAQRNLMNFANSLLVKYKYKPEDVAIDLSSLAFMDRKTAEPKKEE